MKHKIASLRRRLLPRRDVRGQSLVEMTLLLPVLFLMFAGLIELGFAFYNYLTVVNSAREGARYGAKMPEYTDDQVYAVTVTAAKTLPEFILEQEGSPINPERASVIITRLNAPIPDSGDDYEYYIQSQQAFGKAAMAEEDQTPPIHRSQITEATLSTIADEVESALGGITFQQDAQFLVAEVIYDHSQVIGLFQIGEIIPDPLAVSSMTLMRIIASSRQQGCPVCPIALHTSTTDGATEGESMGDIWNGTGPGQFGWLAWGSESDWGSAENLAASFGNPPGNCYLSMRSYDNPYDPADHHLNIDDYVWGNTGVSTSSAIEEALDVLIDSQKAIRIVVWDDAREEGGSDVRYRVARYAKVIIEDYNLAHGWIQATFVGYDDFCSD